MPLDRIPHNFMTARLEDVTGAHAHPCPSLYNLQAIEPMSTGTLVADAVAIVSSIDPILGEVDR